MNMLDWVEILGLIAATCTTISFIPQVVKTYRMKSGAGISIGMYSIFLFGVVLWLIYGCIITNWPIILSNIITLSLGIAILVMTLVFGGREKRRNYS
jgi:MtN3 and saliva related transmembrane protein